MFRCTCKSFVVLLVVFALIFISNCKAPLKPMDLKWQAETLAPICPHCGKILEWKASKCLSCNGPCVWSEPAFDNSPEGAFIRYRLANALLAPELFQQAVTRSSFEAIKDLFTDAALSAEREERSEKREKILASRVVSSETPDSSGRVRMLVRDPSGKEQWLILVKEDDLWKVDLSQYLPELGLQRQAAEEINQLKFAIRAYRIDTGAFPPSGNATLVKALSKKSNAGISYFVFPPDRLSQPGEFLDPWGSPYVYRSGQDTLHGSDFDIYSFGSNRRDDAGTGDDIVSW